MTSNAYPIHADYPVRAEFPIAMRCSRPLARRSISGRILIVEDDEDLSTVLTQIAHSIDPNLEIDWATSCFAARRLLKAHQYDVALVDYKLEGFETGFALARSFVFHQKRAVFAMMSAVPIDEYLRVARHRDYPFLPKPFSVRQCREFIDDLLTQLH